MKMKETWILVVIVMLLCAGGITMAEPDQSEFNLTWVSKYMWRGFDKFDNKAGLKPEVNFNLGGGLSIGVLTWQPMAGGSVDAEEWDYTVAYADAVGEGASSQMDYELSWVYYHFPSLSKKDSDAQEIGLAMSFPEIVGGGLVPKYEIIRHWASKSSGANNDVGGWWHILGFDYNLDNVKFSWDITYNGGAGSTAGADHDWSHTVFGLSTDIDCGPNAKITPAIYYQITMDKSVNTDPDEFWAGISYSYKF